MKRQSIINIITVFMSLEKQLGRDSLEPSGVQVEKDIVVDCPTMLKQDGFTTFCLNGEAFGYNEDYFVYLTYPRKEEVEKNFEMKNRILSARTGFDWQEQGNKLELSDISTIDGKVYLYIPRSEDAIVHEITTNPDYKDNLKGFVKEYFRQKNASEPIEVWQEFFAGKGE